MSGDSEGATEVLAAPPTLTAAVETAASVAASVAAPGAGSRPGTLFGGAITSVGSPLEALERDEIMRTRRFCYITIALSVLASIAFAITPGDDTARHVLFGATGVGVSAMAWLLWRTRDPVRFQRAITPVGWFVPAMCVNAAVLFFGIFSPAPMVVVLGLYFLGLGKSGTMAWLGYAVCALFHGVVAALIISGTVADVGVVQVPGLGIYPQIIVQVLVQLVLVTTMVTARMSRKTALLAVGELEQAVRIATHRQALLYEAREELERALRSGRGRFSDQQLGAYQLGGVLGRGAMGEVYEGTDPAGARVAVKLLSHASLGNAEHVMRFLRELRTASGIVSPHVVRVLEVGEHPVPFLVMELLEGHTLSELLRSRRPVPPTAVVEMIEQVGRGVTAAAAAGIVHRDLKPQNVFRHGEVWKVLDFGVSRSTGDGDTLTAGQVVGTPAYMAPEQASGAAVDHRTDLYALAAIAYRALTGQPPFVAGEIAETLYRVVHTRPTRPTLMRPELHPDVDLALAIGMASRPADRFGTADELARALDAAITGGLPGRLRQRGEALVKAAGWSSAPARQPAPNPV